MFSDPFAAGGGGYSDSTQPPTVSTAADFPTELSEEEAPSQGERWPCFLPIQVQSQYEESPFLPQAWLLYCWDDSTFSASTRCHCGCKWPLSLSHLHGWYHLGLESPDFSSLWCSGWCAGIAQYACLPRATLLLFMMLLALIPLNNNFPH